MCGTLECDGMPACLIAGVYAVQLTPEIIIEASVTLGCSVCQPRSKISVHLWRLFAASETAVTPASKRNILRCKALPMPRNAEGRHAHFTCQRSNRFLFLRRAPLARFLRLAKNKHQRSVGVSSDNSDQADDQERLDAPKHKRKGLKTRRAPRSAREEP